MKKGQKTNIPKINADDFEASIITLIENGLITKEMVQDEEAMNAMLKSVAANFGIDLSFFQHGLFTLQLTINSESDRGCALMMASFLDDQLLHLLSESFVDDEKTSEKILSEMGGLSSFSARIDMAYLLGLITPTMKSDLHLIKRIRNEFAHNPGSINFDDDRIKDRCNELNIDFFDDKTTTREKFIRVSMSLAGLITGARKVAKRRDICQIDTNPSFNTKDYCNGLINAIKKELSNKE